MMCTTVMIIPMLQPLLLSLFLNNLSTSFYDVGATLSNGSSTIATVSEFGDERERLET